MIPVAFRPIDAWPGALARSRRYSPFSASYVDTLDLLDRELRALAARHVVIQLALTEADIRNDGLPRAAARPEHPGVILAFDSTYGPLKYATDAFDDWQANLRAIALGLEALRKVDRYGITKRGEQYTGWKALPPGIAMGPAMSLEDAAELLFPEDPGWLLEVGTEDDVASYYRHRAKTHHPDNGGDADDFRRLTEARDLVTAFVRGRA